MENCYFVYVHRDIETGIPFYVGMGKHRRDTSKNRNELWQYYVARYPKYEVLRVAENLYEEEASAIESSLIGNIGMAIYNEGPLLNLIRGEFIISIGEKNDQEIADKVVDKIYENVSNHESSLYRSAEIINYWFEQKKLKEYIYINDLLRKDYKVQKNFSVKIPFYGNYSTIDSIYALSPDSLLDQVNRKVSLEDIPCSFQGQSIIGKADYYLNRIIRDSVYPIVAGSAKVAPPNLWYLYSTDKIKFIKLVALIAKEYSFEIVPSNTRDSRTHEDVWFYYVIPN